jgi:hypothetical protein
MTDQEAIAVADAYVREKGSCLSPEIRAWRKKRFFRRTHFWQVVSGYPKKGGNWFVAVDDSAGRVLTAQHYRK